MKIEGILLIGVAVFFGITGFVYWLSYAAVGRPPESSGILLLAGTVLLGLLPGTYYLWWSRRMKPRPEDRADATISEGSGALGAFPNSSIWPFVFGVGAFLIALSAVFGLWLLAPAGALAVMAVTGYTAESRRGGHF